MLTKSELEIMDIMWKENRPLTSSQIIDLSTNRSWKKSYIHLLINSLLEKDMIKTTGFVKTTKNYARTFKAKVSKEDYSISQFTDTQNFNNEDMLKIISALVERIEDIESIVEIEKAIKKRKAEIKK